MILWNWQRFLEKEEQANDKYDLMNVTLVSSAVMAENGDHTRLIGGLCEQTSRLWIQARRLQMHSTPEAKMRSA